MAEKQTHGQKTSVYKKVLAAFGIFLVSIGVFLATFGFSFKVMLLPDTDPTGESAESRAERLQIENSRLEKEVMRLEEQNKILIDRSSSSKSDDDTEVRSTSSSSSDDESDDE